MKTIKKAIGIFFILTTLSFAHKLSAFYDIENGKIIVSSYFSDGTPARGAKVKVIDEKNNKVILTGKTNKKGEFSFKLLPPGNYKVVVEGELGHRATTEILKQDLIDAEKEDQNNLKDENKNAKMSSNFTLSSSNLTLNKASASPQVYNLKGYNLNPVVEKLNKIEDQLQNIQSQVELTKRKVLKIEEYLTKPNLIEILGGIGWILGIFGGIALFATKRK